VTKQSDVCFVIDFSSWSVIGRKPPRKTRWFHRPFLQAEQFLSSMLAKSLAALLPTNPWTALTPIDLCSLWRVQLGVEYVVIVLIGIATPLFPPVREYEVFANGLEHISYLGKTGNVA
jgi:hypothetical protein